MLRGSWCKNLKYGKKDIYRCLLSQTEERNEREIRGAERVADVKETVVQLGTEDGSTKKIKSSSDMSILGIAADEEERIKRHSKDPNKILPLVQIGWTEAECRKWCEDRDLLSPIYTTATRGGCWFCHNQGLGQLRILRSNYPDLWALMLKWDDDSPVYFKPNHVTVHDIEERFQMEDEGIDMTGFRWDWIRNGIGGQYTLWGGEE